jgi:hypothetical protein
VLRVVFNPDTHEFLRSAEVSSSVHQEL